MHFKQFETVHRPRQNSHTQQHPYSPDLKRVPSKVVYEGLPRITQEGPGKVKCQLRQQHEWIHGESSVGGRFQSFSDSCCSRNGSAAKHREKPKNYASVLGVEQKKAADFLAHVGRQNRGRSLHLLAFRFDSNMERQLPCRCNNSASALRSVSRVPCQLTLSLARNTCLKPLTAATSKSGNKSTAPPPATAETNKKPENHQTGKPKLGR